MPLAIFGIENSTISLMVTLAILCLVATWLALIAFTFIDARRRIADPFLVGCATAASFFPFVGTMIYSILRPGEYLADAHEREVEVRTSEVRLRHLEEHSCHKCGFPTETGFMRCPSCRTRLKEECPTCSKPVGMDWKLCPYCETALVAPPKRSSRSGSSKSKLSKKPREARPEETRREEPRRSSRSSSKSQPGSGGSSSGRPAPTRPSSSRKPSSSSSRSEETREDRSSTGDQSARTPRSSRRKTITPDDDTASKPINSGDAPAPSRTPDSR